MSAGWRGAWNNMEVKDWVPGLLEELREQVGNLSAALQLLTPVIRELDEKKYDQYLAIANQSVYRMLRLMRSADFADLARRGEPPLFRPRPLDLFQLTQRLSDQLSSVCQQLQVSFRYEQEGKGCLLSGDPHLLNRMLLLLMDYALCAAGPAGAVGLRLAANGQRAVFTVWHGGSSAGVPERRGGPLGLGLDIAHEIAKLHGGSLMMEPRREGGVMAMVSLPTPPLTAELLRSPSMPYDPNGGFSPVLLELSDLLPLSFFLPQNGD